MKTHNKTGAALMITMMTLMVLLAIILPGIYMFAQQQEFTARRQFDSARAFYLAEGTMEDSKAYAQMLINADHITGYETNSLIGVDIGPFMYGTYYWEMRKSKTQNAVDIYAEATVNESTRAVKMSALKASSFAEFVFWVGEDTHFKNGEEFFAPVHVNGKLTINGSVTFHDTVTSSTSDSGPSNLQNDTENGTLTDSFFTVAETKAINHGLWLQGETTISFDKADMLITNTNKNWLTPERMSINPEQIIYIADASTTDRGTCHMESQNNGNVSELDGRVSIFTEGNILIEHHVAYTTSPTPITQFPSWPNDPNTDDALGLISKGNVIITDSAPDDLHIHAVVMATGVDANKDGRFEAEQASGPSRGDVHMIGGVTQQSRGPQGWLPQSKYQELICQFDTRFIAMPPPGYPTIKNKVSFQLWQECKPIPTAHKSPKNWYDTDGNPMASPAP